MLPIHARPRCRCSDDRISPPREDGAGVAAFVAAVSSGGGHGPAGAPDPRVGADSFGTERELQSSNGAGSAGGCGEGGYGRSSEPSRSRFPLAFGHGSAYYRFHFNGAGKTQRKPKPCPLRERARPQAQSAAAPYLRRGTASPSGPGKAPNFECCFQN